MTEALYQSDLSGVKFLRRGKVRDIYQADDKHLLIVATDRLSAFDVVLPDPVPGKGVMLTEISNFWFSHFSDVPSQVASAEPDDFLPAAEADTVRGRAVVVRSVKPLPIEAIVRGYLVGSGWKDYKSSGSVCGIELPSGLQLADKFPEPLYTPSSKSEVHDENISFADSAKLVGADVAAKVRDISLRLYSEAASYALQRGVIIADTKFEFGLDDDGSLVLIDEVLTPDSSRFWPASSYQVGISPPSFDKQYVRDHLESVGWNKQPPGPSLPAEVISETAAKYMQVRDLLLR
ncbi:MAG: phosphoribosylaminoimidazolesuccinocarboxamide synthase [Candidatus Porifericomitaceae bacterium WSBS_2022_MAG_OTU9]